MLNELSIMSNTVKDWEIKLKTLAGRQSQLHVQLWAEGLNVPTGPEVS